MRGVVSLPHGYGHGRKAGVRMWHAVTLPGASINDLTDPSRTEQVSANGVLNGVPRLWRPDGPPGPPDPTDPPLASSVAWKRRNTRTLGGFLQAFRGSSAGGHQGRDLHIRGVR